MLTKTNSACLAAAGLLLLAAFGWNEFGRAASGNNDFLGFYSAGRMAGGSGLYDPARTAEVQRQAAGFSGEGNLTFPRLPYYAALLWPLARLPYPVAYALWEALSLAAVIGFAFAWPDPRDRLPILVACAWSLPLLASMMNGQDCTFVLLAIALAIRFFDRRPALAGVAIALGGIKFHLLLLVPLMAMAQRRFRFLAGLTAGGIVLLAASFAVAGPDWFSQWAGLVTSARLRQAEGSMPNLHGLVDGVSWLEWALAVLVSLAVWMVARRGAGPGWAAALIGSLLISRHAYIQDCIVLLPPCLILLRHGAAAFRYAAFVLLTPLAYLPGVTSSPAAVILPAGLLLLLSGLAAEPALERLSPPKPRPLN